MITTQLIWFSIQTTEKARSKPLEKFWWNVIKTRIILWDPSLQLRYICQRKGIQKGGKRMSLNALDENDSTLFDQLCGFWHKCTAYCSFSWMLLRLYTYSQIVHSCTGITYKTRAAECKQIWHRRDAQPRITSNKIIPKGLGRKKKGTASPEIIT